MMFPQIHETIDDIVSFDLCITITSCSPTQFNSNYGLRDSVKSQKSKNCIV